MRLRSLALPALLLTAAFAPANAEAPKAAPAAPAPLALGAPAPDFTLTDSTGKSVKLSDLKGKTVVLEWTNPGCPFVKRHAQAGTMKKLAEAAGDKVVWLAIDSSHFAKPEEHEKWRAENKLGYAFLGDPDGKVGQAYGARTTPHMFVVDPKGALAFRGPIDDDPHGDKPTPRNYVGEALAALAGGKAPAVAEAEPYGCSVKYAKK